MAAAKRLITLRLDDDLLDRLQQFKERHGIDVTEQIRRALRAWLDQIGEPLMGATSEVLEHLRGVGTILKEDRKTVVAKKSRYDLAVWQEVHNVQTLGGRKSSVRGLKEVTGEIQMPETKRFALVGEQLVLRMDDGRSFPFFFSDSNGNIAARGGIE